MKQDGSSSGVRGMVFSVGRCSIHDGPGIRTTLFLKGCPLRCWWCHSPEAIAPTSELLFYRESCVGCGLCVEACPTGAQQQSAGRRTIVRSRCQRCGACVDACPAGALEMSGRLLTVGDALALLERDSAFYRHSGGGVTISGGEPALQPDFTLPLLRACRARGMHTALDTSGFMEEGVLLLLCREVNLFLYDLKHMDPTKHRDGTGEWNDRILANLELLAARNPAQVEVRLPHVPGYNDDEANVVATVRFLRELGLGTLTVLPYNKAAPAKYRWLGKECEVVVPPSSAAGLSRIVDITQALGLTCSVQPSFA